MLTRQWDSVKIVHCIHVQSNHQDNYRLKEIRRLRKAHVLLSVSLRIFLVHLCVSMLAYPVAMEYLCPARSSGTN